VRDELHAEYDDRLCHRHMQRGRHGLHVTAGLRPSMD
jgi:hypothetical protein